MIGFVMADAVISEAVERLRSASFAVLKVRELEISKIHAHFTRLIALRKKQRSGESKEANENPVVCSSRNGHIRIESFRERTQARFRPVLICKDQERTELSELSEYAWEFFQEMEFIANRVMHLLAPKVHSKFSASTEYNAMDAFCYANPEESIARERKHSGLLPAHVDSGMLTIISSLVHGLECWNVKEQKWERIKAAMDEVVVLTGKDLGLLSQGSIPVCKHRVRDPGTARISLTFCLSINVAGIEELSRLYKRKFGRSSSQGERKVQSLFQESCGGEIQAHTFAASIRPYTVLPLATLPLLLLLLIACLL